MINISTISYQAPIDTPSSKVPPPARSRNIHPSLAFPTFHAYRANAELSRHTHVQFVWFVPPHFHPRAFFVNCAILPAQNRVTRRWAIPLTLSSKTLRAAPVGQGKRTTANERSLTCRRSAFPARRLVPPKKGPFVVCATLSCAATSYDG